MSKHHEMHEKNLGKIADKIENSAKSRAKGVKSLVPELVVLLDGLVRAVEMGDNNSMEQCVGAARSFLNTHMQA